jgi:Rieske 2Fe-2S family protein
MDGKAHGPEFEALSEQQRRAGQTYVTSVPSSFLVGHVDYMRIVRLRPLGPEQTELRAEWLFTPEALADPKTDVASTASFAKLVMQQDADACELNQKGLRSLRHAEGVLMPEEHYLKRFQDWVREAVAR